MCDCIYRHGKSQNCEPKMNEILKKKQQLTNEYFYWMNEYFYYEGKLQKKYEYKLQKNTI